jgi:flagellar protein FlaF
MYTSHYAEITGDTNATARDNERLAFSKAIGLLTEAKRAGRGSRECIEALFYLNRLWGILLEDLAHPDNGLPIKLRADLISIGIWALRQAEDIRTGASDRFDALIEICEALRNGLGRQ